MNFYKTGLTFSLLLFSFYTRTYSQGNHLIRVETNNTQLLLGIDDHNRLKQLSYGTVIAGQDLVRVNIIEGKEAYPAFGVDVANAAIRITHVNGDMTTDLVYVKDRSTAIDSNVVLTEIILKDRYYPVTVSLFYRAFRNENIIEQWSELKHTEKGPVQIYEMASSSLPVNAKDYYVTHFSGDWSNEFNLFESRLTPGRLVLDSKEGVRTAQKNSPSFLLSLDGALQEESGKVIAGTLAWPGNWKLEFNVDQDNLLRIAGGINPYAGDYRLDPNKVFKTPSLLLTYSNVGAGEITRRFHRWARRYNLHNGNGDRDLVLNNWETTGMDFDAKKLADLMKKGSDLGFELFLLDDGWFGNKYPRNTDQAGLGDWKVNTQKLPEGIKGLAAEARSNGLKFGLWIEPEMINPKSELFENHPEWALSAPHRPYDQQRNQLILDLSNPKVQDHIVSVLDDVLSLSPGISYIKWDCNRYLTNAWSAFEGKDRQSNLYTDYANGFLSILTRFRAKYPQVTMMLCASGGGRMDFGSLKYFDEYWPSDNTNAHDRVKIQWGMNYFFPSIGFAAHVSEMGRNNSMKFRFDVAMAGKLGLDLQPGHLDEKETASMKQAIKTYKGIKDIVLQGDLYRLLSPYKYDRTALMYVSANQKRALLFCYQLQKGSGGDFSTVFLRGLKSTANYKLTEINNGSYSRLENIDGKVFSGAYLMEQGLQYSMWNADESNVILLQEQ